MKTSSFIVCVATLVSAVYAHSVATDQASAEDSKATESEFITFNSFLHQENFDSLVDITHDYAVLVQKFSDSSEDQIKVGKDSWLREFNEKVEKIKGKEKPETTILDKKNGEFNFHDWIATQEEYINGMSKKLDKNTLTQLRLDVIYIIKNSGKVVKQTPILATINDHINKFALLVLRAVFYVPLLALAWFWQKYYG